MRGDVLWSGLECYSLKLYSVVLIRTGPVRARHLVTHYLKSIDRVEAHLRCPHRCREVHVDDYDVQEPEEKPVLAALQLKEDPAAAYGQTKAAAEELDRVEDVQTTQQEGCRVFAA